MPRTGPLSDLHSQILAKPHLWLHIVKIWWIAEYKHNSHQVFFLSPFFDQIKMETQNMGLDQFEIKEQRKLEEAIFIYQICMCFSKICIRG